MTDKLTHSDLNQFTGSEEYYKHSLVRYIHYTEGVRYLAEKAGAYWLLDKIATLQMMEKVKHEEFQVWKLQVNANHTATLACEDGNNHIIYSEELTFTDFPLDKIDIYFCNNVIHLPSEY